MEQTVLFQNTDLYSDCDKFTFKCLSCKTDNVVTGPFKVVNGKLVCVLQSCANPECVTSPLDYGGLLRNTLVRQIRERIRRYYENYMTCDEATCNHSTRIYTHVMVNKKVLCDACGQGNLYPQYTATELYNQISYWQYIFDTKQHNVTSKYIDALCAGDISVYTWLICLIAEVRISADEQDVLDYLRETVDSLLARSHYCTVSLKKLFQPFHSVPDLDESVMMEVEDDEE